MAVPRSRNQRPWARSAPLRRRLVAITLILSLGGCFSSGPKIRPLKPLEIPVAGYLDKATTEMTGSFMYENACLLFRDEDSRKIYQPIWPAGTVFNGTSITFHLPAKADTRIVIAEETHIAGVPLDWATMPVEYYAPFQSQCGQAPFFISSVRPAN